MSEEKQRLRDQISELENKLRDLERSEEKKENKESLEQFKTESPYWKCNDFFFKICKFDKIYVEIVVIEELNKSVNSYTCEILPDEEFMGCEVYRTYYSAKNLSSEFGLKNITKNEFYKLFGELKKKLTKPLYANRKRKHKGE